MRIPFVGDLARASDGDTVSFQRGEDEEFPFPYGEVTLNIPEWNLRGKYFLSYGEQDIRHLSDIRVEPNGARSFEIRIRIALEQTTPKVYVSFGFRCLVPPNPPPPKSFTLTEESDEGSGKESDEEDSESEQMTQAIWFLAGVTIYREQ